MTRRIPALLALAALACHGQRSEEIATVDAVPVEVAVAGLATVRAVVRASGTVEPAPGADWTVVAPGPARIAEMPKAEGDRVRPGDLLVRFDAPTLRTDAATKTAEAAQAEASVELARRNHERLAGLLDKGIAARREVDDARKELASAEAALRGARAAASDASALAGRAEVRARFAGVVARRSHNPGDTVDGAAGDPVLRVVDPSRLEVVVAVPLADLARIAPGRAARVRTPGSGEDGWEGAVLALPAMVEPTTGTARVRISAPAGLAVGLPADVEILAEEHSGVVVVPASAIVEDEDRPAVFVVGADGKAQRRQVTLGLEGADGVEVAKGVAAGDRVVSKGAEELPDGAAVSIGPRRP